MLLSFYNHTFYKHQSFPVSPVQRAKFLSKQSLKNLLEKNILQKKDILLKLNGLKESN